MLTPGNRKLGGSRIWGFALPSGTPESCPGSSPTCRNRCYAVAVERYRSNARRRYRRNFRETRRPDFARRVIAFLIAHRVKIVRIHTGGDYYSAEYARAWLRIIERSPRVVFYFYTRSWRVPAIREVLDQMAALSNCRAWFSADRDTGLPADQPPGVRVAWLESGSGDAPPDGVDLVFRVRGLRQQPVTPTDALVCPGEDGVRRTRLVTCDRCGHCWRPIPEPGRTPLPVINPPA